MGVRLRHTWLVGAMLVVHAGAVAWMATRHAPTTDEAPWLVSGLSHLELGRFELGRVNPPLVRTVAAIPVALAEPRTDWRKIDGRPGARAEWGVADRFLAANGGRSFWLFTLARWACLPFAVLGGWVCYRWARDLYGPAAGVLACGLWCLCPNVLGHAQLITPDVAASALACLACYAFWRWLRRPGWRAAALAGLALGLAELAKTTLVLLYPLWPLAWAAWRLAPRPAGAPAGPWRREAAQLGGALGLGLVVLNAGYEFDGTLRPLGGYGFVSRALAGPDAGPVGNRFAGTWAAGLPVPLPQHYLLGIDIQKVDFEKRSRSYMRGEWKEQGGWWYYYLYALAVKVPLGTWALVLLAAVITFRKPAASAGWRDELVLLAPAVTVFVFVSSQTEFTHHLRYVLPAFPFVFVWVGKVAHLAVLSNLRAAAVCVLGVSVVFSSLRVYPHNLSYFNELAGGPEHGYEHLHGSNLDWGQDLLDLKRWLDDHPEARPLRLAYYGFTDPAIAGIEYTLPPPWPVPKSTLPTDDHGPQPGWHAVSTNYLSGHQFPMHDGRGGRFGPVGHPYGYFLRFRPVGRAGYSVYIYHVDLSEANRVRRELGLPELPWPSGR